VLSTGLDRALVLQAMSRRRAPGAENVSDMDLFVAVTMTTRTTSCPACCEAHGARRVVALINRRSYVDLLQAGQIDIAISRRSDHRHAARPRAARPYYPGA